MRVLVTGGAGFIGSHICDRLLAKGHDVAVVDNLSTGRREHVPEEALFFHTDIQDASLQDTFGVFAPQVVCHLAAHIDVRHSVFDPVADARVNVLGTLNLLECCRRAGVAKVIYSGTGGAMFGEPSYLPVDEHHPVNPVSPYGVSKHTVEHYLFTYKTIHGLDFTVLRYPNVYGPRQDPNGEAGVVAIFTVTMLRGARPTIFGDGTKTRDYCYVSDIAGANVLALERGSGGLYNLGRGLQVTDRQVFETVRAAVGAADLEPVYAPERPGEVRHVALDARLAARELNWSWQIDFENGVANAVAYYREQHAA
jgi:UDP-glucose 4-epimerase